MKITDFADGVTFARPHWDDDYFEWWENGTLRSNRDETAICTREDLEADDYRRLVTIEVPTLAEVSTQLEAAHARIKELEKERDRARANYQWMVEHACDQKLDGYRELGARAAAAENARDQALRECRAKLNTARADYGAEALAWVLGGIGAVSPTAAWRAKCEREASGK